MTKHKTKMPLPSKFDHSFSNKRWMGILPTAGSISHNQQKQICNNNNNNKLKLLVIHGAMKSPSTSQLSTEEEEEEEKKDETFCDPNFDCPVASCHELVLMEGYRDDKELVLYNPSTKETRTLPRPPIRPPPSVNADWSALFYGFGLGPKSNDDYKVLRYFEFNYEDENYHTAAGFMGNDVVELYSLKTDSWKRIPFPHPADATPLLQKPFYINGFNYWIVATGPQYEELAIVSFDFAKEIFPSAIIPGPRPNEAYYKIKIGAEQRHHFLLAEYEGSLALVVYDKHEKQIELWVCNFEKGSWSSVGVWPFGVDVFYPLAFVKNHLFYFEDLKGDLVIFDSATQKLKFNHHVFALSPFGLRVFPFLTRTT